MALTEKEVRDHGYLYPLQSPDGVWYGLYRFLYTWAIVEGIDEAGYSRRWCYDDWVVCANAYEDFADAEFKGKPEGWIVEK